MAPFLSTNGLALFLYLLGGVALAMGVAAWAASFDVGRYRTHNSPKKARCGVIIGRFQPVHKGHLTHLIEPALNASDMTIILLGSSDAPVSPKNPWSTVERERMITAALRERGVDTSALRCVPLPDFPGDDLAWVRGVQRLVTHVLDIVKLGPAVTITVHGTRKDASSYYLDLFSPWALRPSQTRDEISASAIRREVFAGTDGWRTMVMPSTAQYIDAWKETPAGKRVLKEVTS